MKLEKGKKPVKDELLDDIPESGIDLDTGDNTEFDDFDFGDDVEDSEDDYDDDDTVEDDDTADIADDDLDDLDEEETEDEQEDEDPEPVAKVQKKNKLTPSEIKVINLKKELAKVAKENAELQKAMQQKNLDKERESIKEKYTEKGYDEDTAEVYAQNEIRMKQLEEKQQAYEFREENEEVFKRYPQAKQDIATIMKNSKLTGMTAEQICKGLYGEVSERETRAINATKGISSKQTGEDKATKAIKSSSANTDAGLTSRDLKYKRYLESKFNDGQKMTVAEFKKYMK